MERTKIDMANIKPELRAEYEGLSKSFAEGVDYLKGRQIGLNELPWYLVIGPPGHGKTTLIRESGIDFAVFNNPADYKDPTKNCGWFISNKAIFVDTAGKYAAGDQAEASRGEWEKLLDLIKESRPDRPINGIIIAISVTAFKGVGSQPKLKEYAQSFRQRVHNVMNELGVRVPIYVTLTMADVISGFDHYFDGLNLEERDHWWGATLEPNAACPPGESSDFNAAQLFDGAFHQFYEHLLNRRLQMLSMHQDRDARNAAALFLKNLSDIRENIRFFIDRLFYPMDAEEDLLFRGFYLTSGTQTERPAVDLTSNLSDILGLTKDKALIPPSEERVDYPEQYGAQSYFVKDFFTDVVIPDENLAELTSKEARRRNKVSGFSLIGSGVITLLCSVLFITACNQSKSHINDYDYYTEELNSIDFTAKTSLKDRVGVLDGKLDEIKGSYTTSRDIENEAPFLKGMGIYRTDSARKKLQVEHHRIVKNILDLHYEETLPGIAKKIAEVESLKDVSPEDRSAFRTFVLLGDDDHYREIEKNGEQTKLTDYLVDMFEQLFTNVDSLSEESYSEYAPAIRYMATNYVAIQAKKGQPYDHGDIAAIDDAFKKLGDSVSSERLLQDLKIALSDSVREATGWGKQINMSDLLNDDDTNSIAKLFTSSVTIPAEFAHQAWDIRGDFIEGFVRKKLTGLGDWFDQKLLDEEVQKLEQKEREEKIVAYYEQLLPAYEAEYFKRWEAFLAEIRLKEFEGREEAEEAMELLSEDPQKDQQKFNLEYWESKFATILTGEMKAPFPFRVLFSVVKEQTVGFDSYPEKNSYPYLRFVHDFQTNEALASGWEDMSENYAAMMEGLRDIDDDSEAALQEVKKVLVEKEGMIYDAYDFIQKDFKEEVEDIDRRLDSIIDQWFVGPILDTWSIVLDESAEAINDTWERTIYDVYYSDFRGRFPFNPDSEDEVSYDDFAEFFGDVLQKYKEEELDGLVEFNGKIGVGPEIKWPNENGEGIPFEEDLFEEFSDGLKIGEVVQFDAKLTTNGGDGYEDMRIDIDNVKDCLDYSVRNSEHTMSFRGDDAIIESRFGNRSGSSGRRVRTLATGPWALVRFAYSGEMGRRGLVKYSKGDRNGRTRPYTIEFDVSGPYKPLWSRSFYSSFNPPKTIVTTN